MRILLPYANITDSSDSFHPRDLGKQIIAVNRMLEIAQGKRGGWEKNKEVQKWTKHPELLTTMLRIYLSKWTIDHGRKTKLVRPKKPETYHIPDWFYYDSARTADRTSLYYKRPSFYRRYGWGPKIGLGKKAVKRKGKYVIV